MSSKTNDSPPSTKGRRRKSKGKNKVSETIGHTTSPLAGIQSQNVVEVGTLDASGRLVIAPDATTGFIPSTESTNVVMDCIKIFYRDAWTAWREIPVFDRDQMWKHFMVKCAWYPQHNDRIFCNFEIQAASLLEGIMSTAWHKDEKPDWMLESIWARLSGEWKKFQALCIQEMVAQASDKGGSLHTGGSVVKRTRRRRLKKKKGKTMTSDEVFKEKPVKNKNGGHRTLVGPHVERTNVGYKKSLDEWRQSQPTSEDDSSNQSADDDEDSVLPEEVGSVKEGKVHNLGSQCCLGCQEKIDSLRRQVQELSKKQKRDRLRFARLESLVQNLIDICQSDGESDDDSDGEN